MRIIFVMSLRCHLPGDYLSVVNLIALISVFRVSFVSFSWVEQEMPYSVGLDLPETSPGIMFPTAACYPSDMP